ncbi:unnamed protein product [Cylindrotheca closterium]|uniref:Uncharacterized protein n=1 Tax=Cylindrotheca closterium TaxID=2856 RepID=A0AAD2FI02_9STRA|nr:unnamed protein product [Cylindrotheca closterium]
MAHRSSGIRTTTCLQRKCRFYNRAFAQVWTRDALVFNLALSYYHDSQYAEANWKRFFSTEYGFCYICLEPPVVIATGGADLAAFRILAKIPADDAHPDVNSLGLVVAANEMNELPELSNAVMCITGLSCVDGEKKPIHTRIG